MRGVFSKRIREQNRAHIPCEIVDTRVRARFHGDELIVTAVGDDGHSCAAAQRGDAP
ncbi:hypothetical protein [Streptomyces mirabilis]|uniref:hypothetical protein n=1 Tax=Streptomyces mirabilis TaxID=68239 RepID=UPI0033AED941